MMNAASSQISKHVLVGFAGACALASAGCAKSFIGEYDGEVRSNEKKIDGRNIDGVPTHVSIAKADGSEVIKLTSIVFKQCALTIPVQDRKGFAISVPDNACVYSDGVPVPKTTGLGSFEGETLHITILGTLPFSFEGKRAH